MAKSFIGMNGFNPNEYAKFDNGINVYTCVTTENNHALTGNGTNIKFVADAPFNSGDTITVNGETVQAQTQDGEPLQDGAWIQGATVVCFLNGTTLNFKGGGGLQPEDKAKLIPENIREGITISGITGNLIGYTPSQKENFLYNGILSPVIGNISGFQGGIITLTKNGIEGGVRSSGLINCEIYKSINFTYNMPDRPVRTDSYISMGLGNATNDYNNVVCAAVVGYSGPSSGQIEVTLPNTGSYPLNIYNFTSNILQISQIIAIKR